MTENEYLLVQKFESLRTFDFKLYDISGRVVADLGKQQTETMYLKLDLSNYVPGMYVLRITGSEGDHSLKFVVR